MALLVSQGLIVHERVLHALEALRLTHQAHKRLELKLKDALLTHGCPAIGVATTEDIRELVRDEAVVLEDADP